MDTASAEPEWLIQAIMDVKELPSWQDTLVLLIEQTLLILREKGVNLFSDMSEEEAGEHIDVVEKLLQSSEGSHAAHLLRSLNALCPPVLAGSRHSLAIHCAAVRTSSDARSVSRARLSSLIGTGASSKTPPDILPRWLRSSAGASRPPAAPPALRAASPRLPHKSPARLPRPYSAGK